MRGKVLNNSALDYQSCQRELIRSLIYHPLEIDEIAKKISKDDFGDKRLRLFYSVLLDLLYEEDAPYGDGLKPKFIQNVRDKGEEPTREEINSIFNDIDVLPPSDVAKLLKERSIIEQGKSVFKEGLLRLDTPGEDLQMSLGHVEKSLKDLQEKFVEKEEKTFAERVEEFDERIKSKEKVEKIQSLYPSLDKYTGGWGKQQLITVAARTSIGKSFFATNCAIAAGKQGKSVLFFSLEMNEDEVLSRLVAAMALINLSDIYPRFNEEMSDSDKESYEKAIEELKDMRIHIECEPSVSVDQIRSIVHNLDKEEGVDFIIIDYLQLLNMSSSYGRTRQEDVAEASRSMKLLAKEWDVPVMVIVQLNRETKGDEDRLPSKADIRESAAIAADSDIVIVIHRKYRDEAAEPKALFILDKNRSGPSDKKVKVNCMLERGLFQDMAGLEEELSSEEYDNDTLPAAPYIEDEFSSWDSDDNYGLTEEEEDNVESLFGGADTWL